jgi:hypothetical protein
MSLVPIKQPPQAPQSGGHGQVLTVRAAFGAVLPGESRAPTLLTQDGITE